MQYIYYTTDESFDFDAPFGTKTYYQTGYHGFTIDFDSDYKPIINSIDGFGEFDDINWKVKDFKSLADYLKLTIPLWQDTEGSTPLREFTDLLELVEETQIP